MIRVCDKKGNSNIITVAWAGTVCTNPAMVSVSVRPERHSYRMMKETGEFVINLTTKELVYATDFCGVKSGRDVDKFKTLGLTPIKGQYVQAPMIAESPVNIECKVRDIQELGSQEFPRVKIGVGAKPRAEMDLADWVLSTFSAQEEKALSVSLKNAAEAALCIIDKGVPEASNRYNGSHP